MISSFVSSMVNTEKSEGKRLTNKNKRKKLFILFAAYICRKKNNFFNEKWREKNCSSKSSYVIVWFYPCMYCVLRGDRERKIKKATETLLCEKLFQALLLKKLNLFDIFMPLVICDFSFLFGLVFHHFQVVRCSSFSCFQFPFFLLPNHKRKIFLLSICEQEERAKSNKTDFCICILKNYHFCLK